MNADNAICFQPERPDVDTQKVFDISIDGEYLRVQNNNVNLLYLKLTEPSFANTYNFLNKYLNFDFSPVIVNREKYELSVSEQFYIEQVTITSSIYFYIVNKIRILLKDGKITLRIPFDDILSLLDKKYGVDNEIAFVVGASVLRRPIEDFRNSVIQRRQYYNK